ncbi:MAG: dihydrodipicolinate synthase family protein [Blastocatellia bacterium]
MAQLSGILPALVTPFDAKWRFNAGACEQLLDRLYAAGVVGVYVCGTTGEGMLQTVEERKQVAEFALRVSPADRQVVVHVGAACLTEAVELARHAADHGAAAVSSLPPAGPYSFEDVKNYYRILAEATDLPLIVYHMPAGGTVSLSTIPQLLELCAIPNVVGLKFTDQDMYKLSELKRNGVLIFNGYDEVLCAGLLMGADGGIGSFYNVAPHLFLRVWEDARHGRWSEARQTQLRINELVTMTLRFPLISGLKTILGWSGIDCGQVRGPRRDLTSDEANQLRRMIAAAGLEAELGIG